jgi:hypothetical protein
VTQKRPLCLLEKRISFYVGSSSARTESTGFIFDEQFADNALAITALCQFDFIVQNIEAYFVTIGAPDPSGNGTSSLKMLANVALRFLPLKGVVPYNIS